MATKQEKPTQSAATKKATISSARKSATSRSSGQSRRQWPDMRSDALNVNVSQDERMISAGGGAALAYLGMRFGGFIGGLMTVAGGYLLFRGATGHCVVNEYMGRDTSEPQDQEPFVTDITQSVTVEDRTVAEVYQYWRRLENLPRFMEHLESVRQVDDKRSQWSARIPGGMGTIDWDAEIVEERPNEFISWRSLPGADVENAGEVRFRDLPGKRGVEIEAKISYRPPAAGLGAGLAKMLNPVFSYIIRNDIASFREHLDEVADGERQTSGARSSSR